MVDIDLSLLYSLAGMLLATVSSYAAQETGNNLIKHLDTVSGQLQGLSRSIRSANSDLTQHQIEQCKLLGPMSNPFCAMLEFNSDIGSNGAVETMLNNYSPMEKRSVTDTKEISKRKTLLEDLVRKQKFLEDLKALVDNAQASVRTERKRSCNLNLGFHCQTEQYSAIADMYNWLQSSLSPGRRKRSPAAKNNLNRLMEGFSQN